MFDTLIGTTAGVHRLRDDALQPLGLGSECISALHAWAAAESTIVLAGSYGNGLFRSVDGGRAWSRVQRGLSASAFRFLGEDPAQPGAILAGTEPARLFRSLDGGLTWSELDGVTRIPGYDRWFLPYSPRAGAVRNVYALPGGTGRLFASVEVGGLLESDDRGRTWVCRPVIADEDIHHITGHPDDADVLYASLGTASLTRRPDDASPRLGGIARSRDGGRSWGKVETDYTRATIVPPGRPDLLLAGPALRVGRGGRIAVSSDEGDTWQPASAGLDVPMPDMVELFLAAPDDSVWAICARGRALRADAGEWTWRSALPPDTEHEVKSIAFVKRSRSEASTCTG